MTELKVKGREDLIECIIEELIDTDRDKEAFHFINKFQMKKFYHLRNGNTSYKPNILEHIDDFEPT